MASYVITVIYGCDWTKNCSFTTKIISFITKDFSLKLFKCIEVCMLETIFGNKTAQLIFLRLYRESDVSAGQLAKDFSIGIKAFQNQLEKFENAGLLVSRKIGNVRLFSFNPQSSYVESLRNLIKIEYDKLGPNGLEFIYSRRKRPRKRGKPILEKGK